MTCGGASCACSRMQSTRKKLHPCVVAKGARRAVRCASGIRIQTALNALERLTFAIVHQRNLFFSIGQHYIFSLQLTPRASDLLRPRCDCEAQRKEDKERYTNMTYTRKGKGQGSPVARLSLAGYLRHRASRLETSARTVP